MKKYLALILLTSFPALAEESKTYTLTLSGQEVGYIGQTLSTRPYNEVVSLINKLQMQLSAQDAKSLKDSSKEDTKSSKDKPN